MILVLAYGNPLRGDDGAGWAAAALLAESPLASRLEIVTAHQLLPEMAEAISRAGVVIFVDVAIHGRPGQVRCAPVEKGEAEGGRPFTHHFTPAGLLAGAQTIYGKSPPAYLITVTGEDFSFSETISPTVAAALPAVVSRIEALIQNE